jgi:glutamate transport system substrate-binding protein
MTTPQALLVRADGPDIKTADDVRGKNVCTTTSTTGAKVEIPGANMSTKLATTRECVDLLDKRGTDAVFTDTLVLYGYAQANPDKFKVVLSGTFGQLQYYGVGLLKGRNADCLKLNEVIKEYLRTQWRHDFNETLPDAASAHLGSNPSLGDFESQFKPKDTDMKALSCKL